MRKTDLFLRLSIVLATIAFVSSCSQDDSILLDRAPSATVEKTTNTRATNNGDGTFTITFEDFSASMMSGPTSAGENLYSYNTQYPHVKTISDNNPETGFFASTFNNVGGQQEYYSGGIALSKWNYRSNLEGNTGDWWYSYQNQCSVYNENSNDGTNEKAGNNGSNNFGVVYGYVDDYNQAWMKKPSFSFNKPKKLISLWICNTSYTYGVIINGNTFGNTGVATPLSDINGYFQVVLECYDQEDNLLNTYTKILADYRGNQSVNPATTWTEWTINQPNVKTVKFNFKGSDTGAYGLNTPAYICIDDIKVR